MKWTPEMDTTLIELSLKSLSIVEQGTAMSAKFDMSFSKNQITSARTRLKLTKPRNSPCRPLKTPHVDTSDPLAPEARYTPTPASHCQYIHNDDMKDPDFCKRPKTHDSYCKDHFELCCPGQVARQRLGWR